MIAVLDGGAVSALAPFDERARARLRALRSEAEDLVVPAGVLAEGLLTGHPHSDFHVRRLLELTRIADIDAGLGYAAGRLRTAVVAVSPARPPSGVDALVAAVAVDQASGDDVVVMTSDVDDLARLLAEAEARRVTIRRV